jgi:CheY-like chemotaxis protein
MDTGQRPCVLIVDDEDGIRELARVGLERSGFRALTADGAEGLALFTRHAAEVRVAVLDLHMPGPGGLDVARALRAAAPSLPLILTSGLDLADAHAADFRPPPRFLPKPFTVPQFLLAVRQAMA